MLDLTSCLQEPGSVQDPAFWNLTFVVQELHVYNLLNREKVFFDVKCGHMTAASRIDLFALEGNKFAFEKLVPSQAKLYCCSCW